MITKAQLAQWKQEIDRGEHLLSHEADALIAALADATQALERVKKHGCCVMHNDANCPGCITSEAL